MDIDPVYNTHVPRALLSFTKVLMNKLEVLGGHSLIATLILEVISHRS